MLDCGVQQGQGRCHVSGLGYDRGRLGIWRLGSANSHHTWLLDGKFAGITEHHEEPVVHPKLHNTKAPPTQQPAVIQLPGLGVPPHHAGQHRTTAAKRCATTPTGWRPEHSQAAERAWRLGAANLRRGGGVVVAAGAAGRGVRRTGHDCRVK